MWNIEKDPVLRSTILAVAIFDSVPDWERLRRRIDRTTLLHPEAPPARACRRRSGSRRRAGPPSPTFDLDFHLRRARLAGPGTMRTLLDALQPIATASFDRARPLWEFTLFEGLDGPDGERAAFAMKVHHSVTDGVGGMELLARFVDLVPDAPEPDDADIPAAIAPEAAGMRGVVRSLDRAQPPPRCSGSRSACPAASRARPASAIRDPLGTLTETVRTTRSVAPHARARDRTDVAGHARPRSRPPPRGVRHPARRHAPRREGLRGEPQRRVRRRGRRRRPALPRAARRGADRVAHDAADQSAPGRPTTRAATASRRPASRCRPRSTTRASASRRSRALVREWRAEPALQMTSTLAGILNRLPDRDHDRAVRRHAQVLRLRHDERSRRARTGVRRAAPRVDRLYAFAPPAGAAFNVALISHCDTCCIGMVIDTTAIPDPDRAARLPARGI